MASKLAAAKIAAWSGVRAVIASARAPSVVADALAGRPSARRSRRARNGCRAASSGSRSRKASEGRIVVDAGARARARRRRASRCCPRACAASKGSSRPTPPVEIVDDAGAVFAKGLSRYAAALLRSVAGTPHRRPPRRVSRTKSSTATTSSCSVARCRTVSRRKHPDLTERSRGTLAAMTTRRGAGPAGQGGQPAARRRADLGQERRRCSPPPTCSLERAAEIQAANDADLDAARDGGHGRRSARPAAPHRRPARGHGQRAAHGRRLCPTRSARCSTAGRRPNGLEITRVRVPLGVIAIIYENRPNVTSDAAGPVREVGQRGDPARLVDRAALERRGRVGAARRARQARPARRRGDPRRRHRVRDRDRGHAAHRLRRLPDPAWRPVADPEHSRERDRAGDHRRRRQLPRLRRRGRRSRRGADDRRQRQDPAHERVQHAPSRWSCTRRSPTRSSRGSPTRCTSQGVELVGDAESATTLGARRSRQPTTTSAASSST